MDGRTALDQLAVEVGDADVSHEPPVHQLRHRPPGLLDRHVRVVPVHLVEVDVIHAKPVERAAHRRVDLIRSKARSFLDRRHLGKQQDIVAAAGDSPPDQPFGDAVAVHLGCVDPRLPGVEGRPYGVDHLGVGARLAPRGAARLPGPVADDADLHPCPAELSLLHLPTPSL